MAPSTQIVEIHRVGFSRFPLRGFLEDGGAIFSNLGGYADCSIKFLGERCDSVRTRNPREARACVGRQYACRRGPVRLDDAFAPPGG